MPKTGDSQIPRTAPLTTDAVSKRNGEAQTLRDSEQRYRALFDHSLDAVYIHDLKGNFIDANDVALRMLGYHEMRYLGCRSQICWKAPDSQLHSPPSKRS